MNKEKLEELGWKFDGFWNNRAIFTLSEDSDFSIFEHYGWGIINPFTKEFELIYCNLADNEIEEYTELIKSYKNIMNNPKENTLYDYLLFKEKIDDFIKVMKNR